MKQTMRASVVFNKLQQRKLLDQARDQAYEFSYLLTHIQ